MSKRKIWNVNEKKHYKMYKSGKQWFFAGMGIVAGLFGAGSTTIASADETPKGANLDLSKSKNLLATKTSATIPGSTSNTNSQNVNSTHNSVTNSASTANQNTQASASQSASKAASASLSASLKASQAASQQKASQSKSQQAANQASDQAKQASEKAKQQAAKTDTKKASNSNSQQHRQADSHKDSTNQQSKSVTKQSTNNGSQANADNRQGSTSGTGSNTKIETSQNDIQNSQSLSIANSVADSVKQSQSLVADKQSLSISQSMIDSMSKSTEKIDSGSTDETPILHDDQYIDGADGKTQLIPEQKDWRDHDDALTIMAPPEIPGYVLDVSQTKFALLLYGKNAPSPQERLDFQNAFKAYAKTASSIDDLNAWIKNSDFYKQYLTGTDPESDLQSVQVKWFFNKQDNKLSLVGKDIHVTVGDHSKTVKDGVESATNADGTEALDTGFSWTIDDHPEWWDQAGEHVVTITYYDSSSLQTITTDITIYVESKIDLNVHDDTVYAGHPGNISEFVDGATKSNGDHVDYEDAPGDFTWYTNDVKWDVPGSYTATITYHDSEFDEYTTKTVTITVVENKARVEGKDTIYNMVIPI